MTGHNPQCAQRSDAVNRGDGFLVDLRVHDEAEVLLQRKALPELLRDGAFHPGFELFLPARVERGQERNFADNFSFLFQPRYKRSASRRQNDEGRNDKSVTSFEV